MNCDFVDTEYGKLPASLNKAKLEELCEDKEGIQVGPFGSQLHKEDYVAEGTPIITVEHLGDNYIIHENTPFVSDKDKVRLKKFIMKEGDIIFSRVGSVDRRALVTKSEEGWLFSGRCLRVRADKSKICPVYLSYFFGLDSFKNYIRGIAVGATMPSINTKILSEIPIYFPDIKNQIRIGQLLNLIDENIFNRKSYNRILEKIASEIFRSWFTNFEPVHAKKLALETGLTADQAERAAMAIISGVCSPIEFAENFKEMDSLLSQKLKKMSKDEQENLRSLAALFPSEFEESRLGEIPKGWADSTIGNEFHLTMGQSPKGDTYNTRGEGTVFYQGRTDFGDRFPAPRVYTTDPKRMAMKGDTLISVRAPVGDKNIAKEDCCIGRGLASLRHKLGALSYTYYLVSHIEGQLDNFAGGGTVFSAINKDGLANFKIIKPITDLIKRFDELIQPLDSMIWNHSDEILTLERVRDTLLPKLLAGEIDLSNISVEDDDLC